MIAEGHRQPPRLHFANQLRGLAAVSVMSSHLIGVFWLMQAYLELTTLAPAQGGPVPALVTATSFEWFQPGPFGVGIFFLVSGLVVPVSLQRHSALSFVAARGLRIFPTYWAGLILQLLMLMTASHVWGRGLPYDWTTILANALLVHDLAGRASIDLVNWTLAIELHFYLLVAVLAPWFRRGSLAVVFGPAIAVCVAGLLILRGAFGAIALDGSGVLYTISGELPFSILMLMGVLFNFHVRGSLGTPGLIAALGVMGSMMAFAWWFSVLRAQFTHVLINDAYALILFGALYAVRRHIAGNWLLDSLAAVSYPLYLVHATLGYLVMKALMLLLGIGYVPALATAVLTAILVAAILHVAVEKPSIRWGHALADVRIWKPARS